MLKKIGMLVLFSTLISGCASSSGGWVDDSSAYNTAYNNGWDALQRQDYKTAYESFLQIAAWDSRAQVNLGMMYTKGIGVPQDYKEAVRWFRHSTEHRNANGQYNLGAMYVKGLGVPQDYKEAVRWFRLSADQGNAGAQHNLGLSYYHGLGVPKDYVLAHTWLNLAISNGNEGALEKRNFFEASMTPSQIEEAQEMARNWKLRYANQQQAYRNQQKRQASESVNGLQMFNAIVNGLADGLNGTSNDSSYKPPTSSYNSNTSSGYKSSTGSTYEYDLSNPSDRVRYRTDPKAKLS
jgi:hypothetical protein